MENLHIRYKEESQRKGKMVQTETRNKQIPSGIKSVKDKRRY